MFNPALAAALAALDMMRTGPSKGAGEADEEDAAETDI